MKKVFICLFLFLCFTLPAAAQRYAWLDGATLRYFSGHNLSERHATITANKSSLWWYTDEIIEESTVTLSLLCKTYGNVPGPIPQITMLDIRTVTIPVPGDADNFEVSRDLGWAGLDTTVMAYDEVSRQSIPVELHISWWANSRVRQVNREYQRGARITGTIRTEACSFDLSRDNYYNSAPGYIFSTAYPQPFY